MAGYNFEDEMNRFEAEIRRGPPQPFIPPPPPPPPQQQQQLHHQLQQQQSMGPVITGLPPWARRITGPTFSSTATISASAKVNYVPPSTNISKKDEEDVFATLLKYEKEIKNEIGTSNSSFKSSFDSESLKRMKNDTTNKMKMGQLMKPMAVTAQEISTKAKQVAEEKSKETKPKVLVKHPGPQIKSTTTTKTTLKTTAATATMPSSSSSLSSVTGNGSSIDESSTVKKPKKQKRHIRVGGGQIWEDESLKTWEKNDYRIFCGDLGNDVTDEVLARTFSRYPSFLKAKVIRDKKSNKTKGYGFVSFRDPTDFTKAMREINGKYVGSRPIKMRKSNWKDRNIEVVKVKQKQKQAMGYKW